MSGRESNHQDTQIAHKETEMMMTPKTTEAGHRPRAAWLPRSPLGILVATMLLMAPAASAATPFEITSFDGIALQAGGAAATQAGSRPFTASTSFSLRTVVTPTGQTLASESFKDGTVELPPGLVGNPQAAPTCKEAQIQGLYNKTEPECPIGSQVGVISFHQDGLVPGNRYQPLYLMQAPQGTAAELAFFFQGTIIHLGARVRTGKDYGVTVESLNAANTLPLDSVTVTAWGVPADPSHDGDRGFSAGGTEGPVGLSCASPETTAACSHSSSAPPKPFFTLPTSCVGPVRTTLKATSWEGSSAEASFLSHDTTPNPVGGTGCETLDFSPTLEVKPTANTADSPTGLDVKLVIPQKETCLPGLPVNCENAEANLKRATVTLPPGLVVNPSSANGLGACAPIQIDLYGEGPAACPPASRLGSVEVETPLLDHPVSGSVYIAIPHDNPFGSLLALYLVVEDPLSGVIVKLAGKVQADSKTGQLTTTFGENPQLPFEDFKLHFFGGVGAALRTQSICGEYSTTAELGSWAQPEVPVRASSAYMIEHGAGGGSCPASPQAAANSPAFEAGTVSPTAGAYSPLVVNLRRQDGSQQFSSLTLTPPTGLLGKLAGIPYCPDSALTQAAAKSGREEEAHPSCPSSSYVGSVTAAAGAGPTPYYAPGRAYLTGPYKGAPLSLTIVTPAVAGPFDLGTVVVRVALYIDPESAKIKATSDPIPSILQGIPLDVRSVQVRMDRPDFTLNPTSCEPTTFSGQLESTLGQTAALSNRFQVGECGRLKFAPKLGIRLSGGVQRGDYQKLRATVNYPEGSGYANIARASVALPHSEFLAQEHIRTICTRVQFAAEQCPADSVYGHARAFTPLLDQPLEGPVYLRSSSNPLPDLVADLHGQIHVALVGRIDSKHGGIRTTFESAPDAPVSKFVLNMLGGQKSLLVNSRNICRQKNRATADFNAYNGKVQDLRPVLNPQCGQPHKHKKSRRGRRVAR